MIIYLLLLCWIPSFARAKNFATSTPEMVNLMKIEDGLMNHLNLYAEGLQCKVDILNLVLSEAELRKKEANGDPTSFLHNPVTSLSLFRRMYEDVPKLVDFLKLEVATGGFFFNPFTLNYKTVNIDSLKAMSQFNLNAINEKELRKAADELFLIQNTYNLNEEDMAKGLLKHKQYDAKLSSLDCIALGEHLWEKQGHMVLQWFKLALKFYDVKMKPLDQLLKTGQTHILGQIAKVHVSMSKVK